MKILVDTNYVNENKNLEGIQNVKVQTMDQNTKCFRIQKVAHYMCGQFFISIQILLKSMNTNIDLKTSHYFLLKAWINKPMYGAIDFEGVECTL
jgi:hypothetical protein